MLKKTMVASLRVIIYVSWVYEYLLKPKNNIMVNLKIEATQGHKKINKYGIYNQLKSKIVW